MTCACNRTSENRSHTELCERLLIEYVQTHVYYNPHTDNRTHTHVNVNADLVSDQPVTTLTLHTVTAPCEFNRPVIDVHDIVVL